MLQEGKVNCTGCQCHRHKWYHTCRLHYSQTSRFLWRGCVCKITAMPWKLPGCGKAAGKSLQPTAVQNNSQSGLTQCGSWVAVWFRNDKTRWRLRNDKTSWLALQPRNQNTHPHVYCINLHNGGSHTVLWLKNGKTSWLVLQSRNQNAHPYVYYMDLHNGGACVALITKMARLAQ